MKILLLIFSLFCFSFSNAQTKVETKADSTISDVEWQKKVDEKLDSIIENLTKKNNIVLFSKSTDASKSKQTDSLRKIIDSLHIRISTVETEIKTANDSIYTKNNRIKSLKSTLDDFQKSCTTAKETLNSQITTSNSRITSLEQNEIASLDKEIIALKDQPYSFSSTILNSMFSRFSDLKDADKKNIKNYEVLSNFNTAVNILKEANASLDKIYSPSVEKILINLDDPSIIPEFILLNKEKTDLKILLGKYCSTTEEVKEYLNGSEQILDDKTRENYIQDNAVPVAEDYKFLKDLCKKVIKDKKQNILKDFKCH